jgi:hypothetical protein
MGKYLPFIAVAIASVALLLAARQCQDLLGGSTAAALAFAYLFAAIFIATIAQGFLKSQRIFCVLLSSIVSIGTVHFSWHLWSAAQRQAAVERVVAELEKFQAREGSYPESIQAIEGVLEPGVLEYIENYERGPNNFTLFYYLVTPSIQHWYDSASGWGHSDD